MSIDLILYAPAGKSAFATFARNNPPNNPLLDDEGNTRPGISYCWWSGSGKFMTDPGTGGDPEDPGYVEPTYAPGHVALLRIHSEFFDNTKLADQTYDEEGNPQLEQHQRSAVAKYIKDNGTPGTMAGIPYYELDGVRILRPQDVEAYCQANGIPGHRWASGNRY
jgi:hypothetical protein